MVQEHTLYVRGHLVLIALLFVAILVSPATGFATERFETPVGYEVSPNGAANFSIPIDVPPGIAGLTPAISLNYSSQGRNGLLGVGWSLGGLSAIYRCGRTLIQDGINSDVTYTANDRFCMDGQRLVVVSGTYGANGAEYRTERESFTRIISYGTVGTGPAYFKAWTKSGQIIEFGNTSDSAIEAQGKTDIRVWAANKISDTVGNYMSILYTEENPSSDYRPAWITSYNAGTTPVQYNWIRFVYQGRTDITPIYAAGAVTKTTQLLTNIQTRTLLANGLDTLVKDYRIAYDTSPASGRSRITSITECSSTECLPATGIQWQASTNAFVSASNFNLTSVSLGNSSKNAGSLLGDFDGDGKTDILRWQNTAANNLLYLSNGNGTFTSASSFNLTTEALGNSNNQTGSVLGDFNGDGKMDVLRWQNTTSGNALFLSNGSGSFTKATTFNLTTTALGNSNNQTGMLLGDFNGDGKTDILRWQNTVANNTLYLSNGNGSFTQAASFNLNNTALGNSNKTVGSLLADFNGDGISDILRWQDTTTSNALFLSNGNGSFTQSASFNLTNVTLGKSDGTVGSYLGDFNGDGKVDIVTWRNPGFSDVYASLGNATFVSGYNFYLNGNAQGQTDGTMVSGVADFNGDGRADILRWFDTLGNNVVYLSDGPSASWSFKEASYYNLSNTPLGLSNGTLGSLVGDFNGDGKADILRWSDTASSNALIWEQNPLSPDLLTRVTSGLGNATNVAYKPLTDSTVYTKDSGATYPYTDVTGPMYVVASHTVPDGIGGTRSVTYKYTGARAHLTGGGFMGFRLFDVTDVSTGIKTSTSFNQIYPYAGLPLTVTQTQSNGSTLDSVTNTWTNFTFADTVIPVTANGSKHMFLAITATQENTYELNGTLVSTVNTSTIYDTTNNTNPYASRYGNATTVTTTTNDGYSKITTNTFSDNTTNWFLGRLTNATVTSTTPSGSATRTSAFTYSSTNGLLLTETIEPNNGAMRVDTTYVYDAYGNKLTATVSGSGVTSRTNTATYDTKGRFPVTVQNALGHTQTRVFEEKFGHITRITDPNGLVSNFAFDVWGRPATESGPDGVVTTYTRGLCPVSNCPATAAYYLTMSRPGTPASTAYFDRFNRQVRSQIVGFNGTLIFQDTTYDTLGRIASISQPYYSGTTPVWTTRTYDLLSRIKTETDPQSKVTTFTYNGLTTTVTNALNQVNTTVKNSQGQVITSTDAANKTVSHTYDPFGNLTNTTDTSSNITTITYDAKGSKTGMNDPDMGVWSYTYDVLGHMLTQTDAKSQVTTFTYDLLGRMVTRAEPDLVTNWTYDTATKGKGKIKSSTTGNGQTRTYSYDSLGRPSSVVTVPGTGLAALTVSTTYDSYGRVNTQTNPVGIQVQNVYNSYGYLSSVRNASTSQVYWTANSHAADGQLTGGTFGNNVLESRSYDTLGRTTAVNATHTQGTVTALGYTYDALSNLKTLSDTTQSLNETYSYDNLNRLTSVASNKQATKTYAYDALGNLTSKSDTGSYTYNSLRANGTKLPHAVSSITGSWATSFVYDANGNIISGGDRTYTYTSFNLPSSITRTTTGKTENFIYGADHERAKITEADGTINLSLNPRLDSGAHFDRRIHPNGVTEDVSYIYAGGRPVAMSTTNAGGVNGINTIRYIHVDAQGSIAALSEGNTPSAMATTTIAVGAFPNAITANQTTNKIYVANMNGSSISVIDGSTNVATPISVGALPVAVAVNSTTNKIYVANRNSNSVTVVNGANNTTSSVAVGTNPIAVAVNSTTNKIYVANNNSNNVTVIDGATNTTAAVVAGTKPYAVAVNSTTNKIYVTNYNSSNVTVINGTNNSTTTVATVALPGAIAVNPVTNKIYVTHETQNKVTVIDGATNATTTITVGTRPLDIAVNTVTNKIYVANSTSSTVTVINGADNTTTTVSANAGTYKVAVNSVTNEIYVTNSSSNNVTVIDGATNTTVTVAVGSSPSNVVVNTATSKVYVANNTSNNVTMIDPLAPPPVFQLIAERFSYDAWGKRRNVNGTDDTTHNLQASDTDFGYTGHLHLDDVALIHMNGRVYDPRLGRFLQADPSIQAPRNLQSYNRYTYVLNNPFMYTDPSGYNWASDVWHSAKDHTVDAWHSAWDNDLFQTAAVIAIAASPCGSPCAAAYSGAYTTYETGSISQGIRSGLIAFGTSLAFNTVGDVTTDAYGVVIDPVGNVAGHAMVGCASAAAGGGSCGSGAASAGAGAVWSNTGVKFDSFEADLVAQTTVGGTISILGGGTFENGARTFGFLRLFGGIADYATQQTDRLKQLACSSGGRACAYDERGVLRTDGARDPDWSLNPEKSSNWFTRTGMAYEGDPHLYENNAFVRSLIVDISKIHDWFNSWNYNPSNGFYMSRGAGFDSVFQTYSFAGMPVAGLATVAGYAGNAPFKQQWIYYNLSRRREE